MVGDKIVNNATVLRMRELAFYLDKKRGEISNEAERARLQSFVDPLLARADQLVQQIEENEAAVAEKVQEGILRRRKKKKGKGVDFGSETLKELFRYNEMKERYRSVDAFFFDQQPQPPLTPATFNRVLRLINAEFETEESARKMRMLGAYYKMRCEQQDFPPDNLAADLARGHEMVETLFTAANRVSEEITGEPIPDEVVSEGDLEEEVSDEEEGGEEDGEENTH
jgi:hypothetical protein